jgi:hypothetical protein
MVALTPPEVVALKSTGTSTPIVAATLRGQ